MTTILKGYTTLFTLEWQTALTVYRADGSTFTDDLTFTDGLTMTTETPAFLKDA